MESKVMRFALRDFDHQHEGPLGGFQRKGCAILWWKMLLPQLNMAFEVVLWEQFE